MRSRAVRFCLVLAAASLLLGGCSVFDEVGSWFATNGKKSNLRGVRILRDKKIAPVDVYSLMVEGSIEQNFWLRPGDTIFLPDNRTQNVFVFGAVKKPGPIPMAQGRMNLLEAIAAADPQSVGSKLEHVRIIRSLTTTTGELLVVDVAAIRRGEALSMQLVEGDVVYVPKNAFGTWNDAIAEILPSLNAVSALLQPFVQIKFLKQYNEYGMKGKIPLLGAMTTVDEGVLKSMGDEAVGVVSSGWYAATIDNPNNKRFVAGVNRDYKQDPGYYSIGAYGAALMLLLGVASASLVGLQVARSRTTAAKVAA